MRKTIVAAFAALALCACTNQQKSTDPTVFEGRFIGYGHEYVEFFLMSPEGYVEVPLNVAEDGTFCDTLTFGTNYDCALFADRYMFRVCVEQGKHYTVEFDLTTESETDFRFIGEGEKENTFLSHYWQNFRYAESVVKPLYGCFEFAEFQESVSNASQPLREELQGVDNKDFVKYYSKELDSYETSYIYYYPFVRIAASGVYRPEKEYLDAIAKAPKLSDAEYSQMLTLFTGNAPYLFPSVDLREALRAVSDYSRKQDRKEEVITKMLLSYASAGTGANLEGAYEYYKENVRETDPELCKTIENSMSLSPGAAAPEIEMEDISGKIFHLADFQGKPLYIDLWASWCGPCCAEIPHLAKLVESLGTDPEIVCISISIDDDRNNWTAKLAEEDSSWPQFLATKEGMRAVSKDYGVSGIPRFILINPDGTLASVNAPRPSDPGILESLKSLL